RFVDLPSDAFPWDAVAIVGVCNTRQARRLPDATTRSLTTEAVLGALADAGLGPDDVDGLSAGPVTRELVYDLRLGPAWTGAFSPHPILTLFECAAAIVAGMASVVVLAGASAGVFEDPTAAAPWTRPEQEFAAPWGLFTAAEFALVARSHMD